MALSYDILSQFAKITNDKPEEKKESTAYGTIVKYEGVDYVKLDGSDLLTPYTSTIAVEDGDRVIVSIKNHSATVTGSTTNPAASNKTVTNIGDQITEFEIVIADKVVAQDIEAINGYFETIKAISGKYQELSAVTAKIETLQAKYANLEYISAIDIKAISAEIESIKSEFGEFTQITAEDLEAINAEFTNVEAYNAKFTYVSAEVLKVIKADIQKLNVDKLDVETADIKYANIDFANITEAAIRKIFSDTGIIKDLIVSEGTITGELVGVTIKGDLIEGNTIKADKLVVRGEDGLYYKLNVDALGETTASSDEKYQNGIDGSVIIAKSITAERISVDDLVAFGATIGGFHITDHSLYSGVKESVNNTTQGVFLGDDGQIAIGDSNNYLKFFVDEDGKYKLELSASSLKFSTSGKTVEETISTTVQSTEVEYYLSNSSTSLDGGIWQNTAPAWIDGKYMWSRTKITLQSGTIVYKPSENGTCISGATGQNGQDGEPGKDGSDGKSAYQIWLDAGNIGTEEDYLNSLKGADGEPGKDGQDGKDGAPGQDGQNGKDAAIQSDTPPEDTSYMWYDTTVNQLKRYDGTDWIVVNDWSGALNDLNNTITNNTNELIETYKRTVDSKFESIDKGYQMTFAEISEKITNLDGTVNSNYNELVRYIQFNNGSIILGQVDNPLKLTLTNDRLSFTQNGIEVAYVSDHKLYIYDGEFLNSLKLGRWVWIIEQDNGLSLNYV